MSSSVARVVPVGLLALASAAFADNAPPMKEGLWEITSRTEMSGMPASAARPMTMRRCFTQKDIQGGEATASPDSKCAVKNMKVAGNRSTWDVECSGPEAVRGSGSVTYDGDRYSGETTMRMNAEGKSMQVKSKFEGKRLGDCKK